MDKKIHEERRKEGRLTFSDIIVEYFKGLVLFGVVMVAFAVWMYVYHYSKTGDDVLGVMAALAMFLGTFLIGQGIRGWRDGAEIRNQYFVVKDKRGVEVVVKRRKKRQ